MRIRPTTPEQLQERISQWAQQVAGSVPRTIPIHNIGPADRSSIFNVRDFCHQHDASPVFGWSVHSETFIIRAHFCAVVRLSGKMFSVTSSADDSADMMFFEDRARAPRYVMTYGAQIIHIYHSLVFPEISPARRLVVASPDDLIELPMDAAASTPPPRRALSTYPPVGPTKGPSVPVNADKPSVVHPALRGLKRYASD